MMPDSQDNFVKILFRYYSNALDEWTVETMWASLIDANKGYFKIENIPFYGPPVSSEDIVFAEFDESEEMLTYRSTVEHSGNSIVQVVLLKKEEDIQAIRNIFERIGCSSEKLNSRYFAMEVPANVEYAPVRNRLIELQNSEIIDFAEPWLSEKHQL